MKTCTNCNIEKLLTEFYKDKTHKDGYTSQCKICVKDRVKKYREENIEDIRIRNKLYERNNKDKAEKRNKKWYSNNKEVAKERTKRWNCENRERVNKNKVIRHRERCQNEPEYRMKYAMRHMLRRCLKNKTDRTYNILKYTPIELKNHLEFLFTDGMTWDNYGEWHIDHIVPLSSFDVDTPPSVVNALSNLQPLWATTREINGVVYEGNLNKWIN